MIAFLCNTVYMLKILNQLYPAVNKTVNKNQISFSKYIYIILGILYNVFVSYNYIRYYIT